MKPWATEEENEWAVECMKAPMEDLDLEIKTKPKKPKKKTKDGEMYSRIRKTLKSSDELSEKQVDQLKKVNEAVSELPEVVDSDTIEMISKAVLGTKTGLNWTKRHCKCPNGRGAYLLQSFIKDILKGK